MTKPESPDRDVQELPNLAVRTTWAFTSPGRLFDRLRERPAWVGALLTLIGVSLLVAILIPEELFRQAFEAQLPPEAEGDPEVLERMATISRYTRFAGAVLGPALSAAVIAGLLTLTYDLVLGGEAGFGPNFSAACHALLVPTIGGLLTVPLVLATGDLQTTLGLHLLVPGIDPDAYAFRLLRGLTVFGLWCVGLLGVAISKLYPTRSAGGATAFLLVAYVALKAAIAIPGGA